MLVLFSLLMTMVLLLLSLLLFLKVWDDQPLRTSSFATILPGISKTQLRTMEFKILNILQFNTGVPPSMYARYYFELRTLFDEVIGRYQVDEWRTKPLSIRSAQRLEDRCSRSLHCGSGGSGSCGGSVGSVGSGSMTSASTAITTSGGLGTTTTTMSSSSLSSQTLLPSYVRVASMNAVSVAASPHASRGGVSMSVSVLDDVPVRTPLSFSRPTTSSPASTSSSRRQSEVVPSTSIQQETKTEIGQPSWTGQPSCLFENHICVQSSISVSTESTNVNGCGDSFEKSEVINSRYLDHNACDCADMNAVAVAVAVHNVSTSPVKLQTSHEFVLSAANQLEISSCSMMGSSCGSTCLDYDINNSNNSNNALQNPNMIASANNNNNNPVSLTSHLMSNFNRISLVVDRLGTPRDASRTLEDVTCSDTSRFVIS